MMERHTDESIAAFRRAVELNPNSAAARSHLSRGLAFAGLHGEAIEHGEAAIRLAPFDPQKALFLGGIAVAKHAAGRFDEAVHWSVEAQRLRPGFQGSRRMLCANLALAGRADEARAVLSSLRRDQPELSMSWLTANVPYQTSRLIERYQDGMWKAGLR
jgi:tetratricopeptide (TPR) repeat protein